MRANSHQLELWAVFENFNDQNPIAYFTGRNGAVRYIGYNYPNGLLVPFIASVNQWSTLMQKGRVHWADLVQQERDGRRNPTVVSGSVS